MQGKNVTICFEDGIITINGIVVTLDDDNNPTPSKAVQDLDYYYSAVQFNGDKNLGHIEYKESPLGYKPPNRIIDTLEEFWPLLERYWDFDERLRTWATAVDVREKILADLAASNQGLIDD